MTHYTTMLSVLRALDADTPITVAPGRAPCVERCAVLADSGGVTIYDTPALTFVPVPLLERLIQRGYVAGGGATYCITERGRRYRDTGK